MKEAMPYCFRASASSAFPPVSYTHLDVYKRQALDYENKMFRTLTPDEYLDYITEALSILPPDMVIHRVTGDVPKDLVMAPLWSANKRMVLNSLQKKMKQEHIFQGKFYHGK